MAHINLIAWDNQRGLSHDLHLLRQTLEGLGHQVSQTNVGPKRRHGIFQAHWLRLRMIVGWLVSGGRLSAKFDLNIFLEHARPAYLKLARRNAFIPNPEWFSKRDQRWLRYFDRVLTKTRIATDTFAEWGYPTTYIGFLSVDRWDPNLPRQASFLHLAGASRMKGTQDLLTIWQRHPEWPRLIVQQSPLTANPSNAPTPANIEHRIGYAKDISDITRMQNSFVFHLCLSEAEGWGHYIVEAMGCGAVTITCDAPPMNELVQPDRGILVHACMIGRQNAAMRYRFDEISLEEAIERAITMTDDQRRFLQSNARAWFLDNNQRFASRLAAALQLLL